MDTNRRDFLKTSTAVALTSQIFTGNVRGANDRISAAFIGMGKMGRSNLGYAMRQDNLNVTAVCDIFDRNLNMAVEMTKKQPSGAAKGIRDFREILADKSIDVVCISTPDHWHPYMTVEACKAGKDVYVEKPICVVVDEGVKMVQAARKYKRVVQAGTMQRSAVHFAKAAEIVAQRTTRQSDVRPLLELRADRSLKASASRPMRSRRRPSTGICGWVPRPSVPTIRTASASILRTVISPASAGSGITPEA